MRKLLLILFLGLFLVNLASAVDIPTVKLNETIQLIQYCPSCTFVNLSSITFPDNTQQYFNEAMTKNGSTYNYSFSGTSQIGKHIYFVEGDKGGTLSGESLEFEVTSSGNSITEGNSLTLSVAILFFMILSILLFINFSKVTDKAQVKWTSFLLGFIFMLAALNLISLTLLDSIVNPSITSFIDFFIASSFYMYWLSFGLLAVIWIITIINTILFKQKIKSEQMFNPI